LCLLTATISEKIKGNKLLQTSKKNQSSPPIAWLVIRSTMKNRITHTNIQR